MQKTPSALFRLWCWFPCRELSPSGRARVRPSMKTVREHSKRAKVEYGQATTISAESCNTEPTSELNSAPCTTPLLLAVLNAFLLLCPPTSRPPVQLSTCPAVKWIPENDERTKVESLKPAAVSTKFSFNSTSTLLKL